MFVSSVASLEPGMLWVLHIHVDSSSTGKLDWFEIASHGAQQTLEVRAQGKGWVKRYGLLKTWTARFGLRLILKSIKDCCPCWCSVFVSSPPAAVGLYIEWHVSLGLSSSARGRGIWRSGSGKLKLFGVGWVTVKYSSNLRCNLAWTGIPLGVFISAETLRLLP